MFSFVFRFVVVVFVMILNTALGIYNLTDWVRDCKRDFQSSAMQL